MISVIFIHFQLILRESALTVGIFLNVLSHPFFKFKLALGYPKILIVVKLIIIYILLTAKSDSIERCVSRPEKSKQTFVHR